MTLVKKEIKNEIEKLLCSYSTIIICNEINDNLVTATVKLIKEKKLNNAVLVFEDFDYVEVPEVLNVSKEILNGFREYYNLYEYTDKIVMFTDDTCYPGISNYVAQGIITEDEMLEALLYKIS